MTKIDYSKLFSYINREVDEATRREVERWRKADARHEAFYKRACDYYRDDPTANKSFSAEQLDRLFESMLREKRRRRRIGVQRWSAAAAAVIVLAAAGAWLATDRPQAPVAPVAQAVPPLPSDEIVVITETGQRLTPAQLAAGDIARQTSSERLEYLDTDSLPPADSAALRVETHTIVVPRGTTFELRLSDGSRVLLSPASELTYPVRFDTLSPREVTLKGEALFQVAKASNRFVVNTSRMRLQVYGTVFNVLARSGRTDEAVLLEGSVGVSSDEAPDREAMLRPGQRSRVDSAGHITVAAADLAVYTARRNGYLLFNGKTVPEIIRELELYYDTTFVEESAVTDRRAYVLSFKLDESLRGALDVIEAVADVQFTIQGKEVRIKAK